MFLHRAVPTCWDCKHSTVFEDLSVGINAYAECDCGDIREELWKKFNEMGWDEIKCGKECPHFEPQMISECSKCKREMNIPKFAWGLWASNWEDVPVCSLKCKREIEKTFDKEMKEDRNGLL